MKTQEEANVLEEKKATKYYKSDDRIIRNTIKMFDNAKNDIAKEVSLFYNKYGIVREAPRLDENGAGATQTPKLVVTKENAKKKLSNGNTRQQQLEKNIANISKNLYSTFNDDTKDYQKNMIEDNYIEQNYTTFKVLCVGVTVPKIKQSETNEILKSQWEGRSFSDRNKSNSVLLVAETISSIDDSINKGLSSKDAVEASKKPTDKYKNYANTSIITFTTVMYVASSALANKNNGIATEYIYIATLDDRTTPVCTDLDGKVFKYKDRIEGVNSPAMHYRCRSTTGPYFGEDTQTRIAREVETGNTFTVPGNMDVKNYKAIYVDKTMTRSQWDSGKRTK